MFCLLLQYVVLTLSFLTFMLLSIDQKRRGPNVIHQTIMVLIRMSKPYNRWFGIGYFVGSILNVLNPQQNRLVQVTTTKMWTFFGCRAAIIHSLLSLSLNDEGCAYSNELISFCLSSHFYASGQKSSKKTRSSCLESFFGYEMRDPINNFNLDICPLVS